MSVQLRVVAGVGAALLACAVAGCAAPAPEATASRVRSVALPNADLEAEPAADARCPPRWGCKSHADPNSHRFYLDESAPAGGKRSLCIERVTAEPWALATVVSSDAALRGARVRFSIDVRVDASQGAGGPWILVHGPFGNLHHDQRVAGGSHGWRREVIEFTVAPNALMVEVGATLEGAGRVCLDNARLEILGAG
jgi:hypothetical protein